MIQRLLDLDESVRYAAVYRAGELALRSKGGRAGASSNETDRYEELLVNPTLLKLATQRGEIDCGGLDYLILRYGNFFQVVVPAPWGHVSVCVEKSSDPVRIAVRVVAEIERYGAES